MTTVKVLNFIDRAAVLIAVIAIIVLMILITVSVIGRYFLSMPIPGDVELSEFLMVFIAFLPLAAVQADREHVFVTIFTDWASNDAKVVMETIGVAVGFFIFAVIGAATFTDFHHAWSVGSYTEGQVEFPQAPPRFVVFLGISLFVVRLLVDAVRSVIALLTGQASASRSETERALDDELQQ